VLLLEGIVSGKVDRIGAVPEQSLLPWSEVKIHMNSARFHRQRNLPVLGLVVNNRPLPSSTVVDFTTSVTV
jgi:hypothetical protein